MVAQFPTPNYTTPQAFLIRANIELHRAERYRVLVSLTVLDLEFAREHVGRQPIESVSKLRDLVRAAIRDCDYMTILEDNRLVFLFPETSRQGAEIAVRRLSDLVRRHLSDASGRPIKDVIPVEMASFPDTAGAKTLAGFLEELASSSRN